MNQAAISGVSARVARDFRLATRGGPFRVALALSLVVHLAALFALGRGGIMREGARDLQQMHVRLVVEEPRQDPAPAAPAIAPLAGKPRRELPGETAALVPGQPPASTPPAPAAVPSVSPEPTSAPAPDMTIPAGALGPETVESAARPSDIVATGLPQQLGAADAPPPISAVEAPTAPTAPTPAVGAPGTAPVGPYSAPAVAGTGSAGPFSTTAAGTGPGGATATAPAGGGLAPAGIAGAPAGAADPASAATATIREPGPRDLASVRRRIDARKVYPRIALRNGWEGRVLVEMRLEGDGRLADVRLLEGSGYTVLDEETIAAVRRASPFPPIARVLTVPVEYRLVP